MKDQNSVDDGESKTDKYNRAVDLYIESVHKPDTSLRACAHNQKCFNELMDVRQQVLEYVYRLRASHPTGDRSHKFSMEHDSEGC